MSKKPETRFKERILPALRALRASWVVKTQMLAILGIPDILMCLNGHFVALELKKGGRAARDKRPSKLQGHILSKIRNAGGTGILVTPQNWPQVFTYLERLSERSSDVVPLPFDQ